MRAMHEDAQTLLNVMNVFITEPLLDWIKPAGNPQRMTTSTSSGPSIRSETPSAGRSQEAGSVVDSLFSTISSHDEAW